MSRILPLPPVYCHLDRNAIAGIVSKRLIFVLDNSFQGSRMRRMTVAQKKQPAFMNLHEHGGNVSLWVNRTLLPSLSNALQRHEHHSLQDFSIACTQAYRGEISKYQNDHCSIQSKEMDAVRQESTEKIAGVSLTFHAPILAAASGALMGSKNRAIGKIGLEIREIARK